MEMINNGLTQFGAVGLMVVGLIWFTKFLITYNFNQLTTQQNEYKLLEKEFRTHLTDNEKLLLSITEKNTEAFNKTSEAFKKLVEAFDNNSVSIDKLTDKIGRICNKD